MDTSPILNATDTTMVQSIVVALLIYTSAIDNTLLPAISTFTASQSKPTQSALKQHHQLLDNIITFPQVEV